MFKYGNKTANALVIWLRAYDWYWSIRGCQCVCPPFFSAFIPPAFNKLKLEHAFNLQMFLSSHHRGNTDNCNR